MKFSASGAAARPLDGPLAVALWIAAAVVMSVWWGVAAAPSKAGEAAKSSEGKAASADILPASPREARIRSQLLHEMIHGALQVMHRDFFDEDESSTIPSRSLEDVFSEMEDRWQVEMHWLTVNAEPMNVDHDPRDEFEKQAVKALSAGETEFAAVEGDRFRFVGTIRLGSQCLKCHVPNRTSLEDRAAGLVITMPIKVD